MTDDTKPEDASPADMARKASRATAAALKKARADADAKGNVRTNVGSAAEPKTPPPGTGCVSVDPPVVKRGPVEIHVHGLTVEQYEALLAPIVPTRVRTLKNNSYVEVWDVRRHLIRIFGFTGWAVETRTTLVNERPSLNAKGEPAVTVVYTAEATLTVRCRCGAPLTSWADAAAGDAINFPPNQVGEAHGFAVKSAASNALKRAAVNLGDQFGLSLYEPSLMTRSRGADGSQQLSYGASVGRTLAAPAGFAGPELATSDMVTAGEAEAEAPPTGVNTPMGPSEADLAYTDGYRTAQMHTGPPSRNGVDSPRRGLIQGEPGPVVPYAGPADLQPAEWAAAQEVALPGPVADCPWPDAPYEDEHVWVNPGDGIAYQCNADHSEARARGDVIREGPVSPMDQVHQAVRNVRQAFPEVVEMPAEGATAGPMAPESTPAAIVPPGPAQQADGPPASPEAVRVNALRQILATVPGPVSEGLRTIYGTIASDWAAYNEDERAKLAGYVDAAYFRLTGKQRPALPSQWED